MNTVGAVSIIVGAILGALTLVYTVHSRGEDKQDIEIRLNKKNTTDTRLDIKTIQADLGHIKDDIKDSKLIQERIFTKLDELEK